MLLHVIALLSLSISFMFFDIWSHLAVIHVTKLSFHGALLPATNYDHALCICLLYLLICPYIIRVFKVFRSIIICKNCVLVPSMKEEVVI